MWDQRFGEPGFAYGTEPNDFLRSVVDQIPEGELLCIGEGEGRNAVFLAQRGYRVVAVDASRVGLDKTEQLAKERGVTVETIHADLASFELERGRWNGIVEIFCHLPLPLRQQVHRAVAGALKPAGVFVLEAYTPDQLRHGTGGPPVRDLLYELESVQQGLGDLEMVHAREIEREVQEGKYHHGLGAVMQILARKPSAAGG